MRIEWLNQENMASLASLASGSAPVAPAADGVSRRGFMKAAGGGLVLGFFLPGDSLLFVGDDFTHTDVRRAL